MSHAIVHRDEMTVAKLRLGDTEIDLADYVTTGLRVVCIGPSGSGKSNSALVIAEQLAALGWVSVLIDPEGELASLYGGAVGSPDALRDRLTQRDQPMVVVAAKDAEEFIPYGEVIQEAADTFRKPIFVAVDEGQLFSRARSRANGLGEASDLVGDFLQRGRKRALDCFISGHRFAGSLHRTVYANKNLTLIGRLEDPAGWASLAQMFRGSQIGYSDLAALAPGEFFCFSRRGIEKVTMQMANALAKVAPKARVAKPILPSTFRQWDQAMAEIPTERLEQLDEDMLSLFASVTGLSNQQYAAGVRALSDELANRQ